MRRPVVFLLSALGWMLFLHEAASPQGTRPKSADWNLLDHACAESAHGVNRPGVAADCQPSGKPEKVVINALVWIEQLAFDKDGNPIYAPDRPAGTPYLIDLKQDGKKLVGTHGTGPTGTRTMLIDHFHRVEVRITRPLD